MRFQNFHNIFAFTIKGKERGSKFQKVDHGGGGGGDVQVTLPQNLLQDDC